ncbi:GlsB/YeaQ/YmgE family stress response membrane protein [Agrococcus sp. ARC_14]|uniref:GlsB/YeaQ/YmgE family stress response membrane protein n=1 Tax=Agrococcus sp. ARC_14 TaxID=2919927 RepID=UPI001F06B17A|nr:GlsB/YeaQ/YmgE family stress response membrane protein [Agrococcus sp. ARC_14]MCH1882802.1 GlsB/YeaQ/YmgE family stress response membrane protein [Agrococcus sp. ARC_14]
MGFFVFLIFGLIAGALAKLILPGKQGGGWLVTLLLGVVGAMLGGWIAGLLGQDVYNSFWSPLGWLFAIGGAILVLLIWGLITKNRGKTSA